MGRGENEAQAELHHLKILAKKTITLEHANAENLENLTPATPEPYYPLPLVIFQKPIS